MVATFTLQLLGFMVAVLSGIIALWLAHFVVGTAPQDMSMHA
jgi:hypothetical protein